MDWQHWQYQRQWHPPGRCGSSAYPVWLDLLIVDPLSYSSKKVTPDCRMKKIIPMPAVIALVKCLSSMEDRLRYNFGTERKTNNVWKAKRMDRYNYRLTRMRVLYRKVKLTGSTGKIERSADALRVNKTCTFHKLSITTILSSGE